MNIESILTKLDELRALIVGDQAESKPDDGYRPDGFSEDVNGFGARSHRDVDAVFEEFSGDPIAQPILDRQFQYLAFSQERHPELAPENERHQEIVLAVRSRLNLIFNGISSGPSGAMRFDFTDEDIDRLFGGVRPDASSNGYVFSPRNDINPPEWTANYAREIRIVILEAKADADAGIIRPDASPNRRPSAADML